MHVILIANPLVIYVLNITLCRWKELYYYHFRSILEIYLRQSYSRVYFFCCFKCFSLEFEKETMFCQNYHFMIHWYFLCQMYWSTFFQIYRCFYVSYMQYIHFMSDVLKYFTSYLSMYFMFNVLMFLFYFLLKTFTNQKKELFWHALFEFSFNSTNTTFSLIKVVYNVHQYDMIPRCLP